MLSYVMFFPTALPGPTLESFLTSLHSLTGKSLKTCMSSYSTLINRSLSGNPTKQKRPVGWSATVYASSQNSLYSSKVLKEKTIVQNGTVQTPYECSWRFFFQNTLQLYHKPWIIENVLDYWRYILKAPHIHSAQSMSIRPFLSHTT